MPTYCEPGLPKHKPAIKNNNYACQICRAPHEICQRCQTTKHAAILTSAPPPTARRGRPRATLSSYR